MSSLTIACLIFGGVLLSTLVAMALAQRLPEHHLGSETRDVVKQGLAVIGTLTALVLGLLVSSTKGTFDAQNGTIKEVAMQIAMTDRLLARYGVETKAARAQLRELAEAALQQMHPEAAAPVDFSGGRSRDVGDALFESIAALEPANDTQRMLRSRAQDIVVNMAQLRQRLVVNDDRTLPWPLLVMLGVWQAVLFAGFGLLTPRNVTAFGVLLISMVSVSGAIFLVLELDHPFSGIVHVSDVPLRSVIGHLGE